MSEFKEYPKSLYINGTWESVEAGLEAIVKDSDEEAEKRAEGYKALNDPAEEPNPEKSALLEEAKSLGIDAKGTWGIQKLTDAINEVKAAQG